MSNKEIFKKIIRESQRFKPEVLSRDLRLPVDTNKTIALYGPRRSGKTYLFYQTIKQLINKGVNPDAILYVNFEDERILPFNRGDWEVLLESYYELYPENIGDRSYFFFDEVQETVLWDKFVRRLSEKGATHTFITGSSSKLLSKEIATSLRGRTLSYMMLPLSFAEFLRFKGQAIEKGVEYSEQRYKVRKLFNEYVQFGGFPETLHQDEPIKRQTLQGYFELTFYKDIVDRYQIRNFGLMKELMRYLITHFSSIFSVGGYYNYLKSTGQKIGKDTVYEYLSWLEEVNFVKMVPVFDYSLKRQTLHPKKLYCIDTGLITAVSLQFSENRGRYLENIVFLELLRQTKEIYYFKNREEKEIDFFITEKSKPSQLIQVTTDLTAPGVKEREVEILIKTSKEFNVSDCLILTDDQKDEIIREHVKIKVIPIWLWLLGE